MDASGCRKLMPSPRFHVRWLSFTAASHCVHTIRIILGICLRLCTCLAMADFPPTVSGRPPSKWTQPHLYFASAPAFERAGATRNDWFEKKGAGYYHMHSTKPQTLGYSLADSPVGLLAWIYEKLIDWSDGYAWPDDEGTCIVVCLCSRQ
jgi:hypothetical protein